ncbi:MAG: TetR/AcrR family transcriptional regulator [Chloroflexi bacterium]|nr:TetR/AcrR family transcriptional regulator [Chloroflexota bacterium]
MTKDEPTREERIRRKSRKRREDEKQEVRQAILSAATALFLKLGTEGFSLRGVAEEAGYSPGTIYLYFENKDDLLYTVADEGFQRFLIMLHDAASDNLEPIDQLRQMANAYVSFGLDYPAHYRVMFIDRTDFIASDERAQDWQATLQALRDTVQKAIDSGDFQPVDVAATSDALWAFLHGAVSLAITMQSFDAERRASMLSMTHQLIDTLVDGLRKG